METGPVCVGGRQRRGRRAYHWGSYVHFGSRLELNARVKPGGSIRAEFLDAAGRPIKEAGLSSPCTGDSLKSKVAWSNNAGIIERLKGKPVCLRFHLRSAELDLCFPELTNSMTLM